MRGTFGLLAASMMTIALAGCDSPPPVFVDGGYVRLNPNPSAPSAAYFSIHGGAAPIELRGITTDEAVRLEIHESMTQGGMASMKPVNSVPIAAGQTVKFAPGGTHVMLWNINPAALTDGKIEFTFLFSNGDRIIVDAVVQKADGSTAAPSGASNASDEHAGH